MLLNKIKESEIQFMECWNDSICMLETLFPDFDTLSYFDKEKFSNVRLYQRPMVSQSSLIDYEATAKYHKLNEKEKFNLKKNVEELYNLGGRGYGKTLYSLKLDIILSSIYDNNLKGCLYAIDESRLRGVVNPIKRAFKNHPILKIFNYTCSFRPFLNFINEDNGWSMRGVNMTLKTKTPGEQFFQIHSNKFWGEEVSKETDAVANKKKGSLHELGAINRLAGMTDFPKHSPTGKIFHDRRKKRWILNLPRYASPYWTEDDSKEMEETYGGKDSLNFKIYVDGEPMPDAYTEFDMERIENCYLKTKKIKRFELKKEQYKSFKDLVIVDRPKNADRIFIVGDIGDGAGGSDINIFSEVGEKYYWLYNIVLYKMTEDEQYHIFKYLVEETKANVLGFDCGEACGRGLYDRFEKEGFKENLVWYRGNSKVTVGFEKDEKGQIKRDRQGKPIPKEEKMREWGVKRLKKLFYPERLLMPHDYKIDTQLSSVLSIKTGNNKLYECISETGDHLFDCFLVFANAQWLKKDFNATPEMRNTGGLGISSGKSERKNAIEENKIEEKILNAILNNTSINCTKEEYKKFIKDYLLRLANKMVFTGDTNKAKNIMKEFKKLENKYSEEI